MGPMAPRASLAAAVLLLSLVTARPAAALDEGDWQLAASATLGVGGGHALGPGGRLEGRWALTDAVSFGGSLGASWNDSDTGRRRFTTAAVSMTIAWDVLRWVPFGELGFGFIDRTGPPFGGSTDPLMRFVPPRSDQHLGFELAGGAEYLVSPRWSVAAVARAQLHPITLHGGHEIAPLLLSLGLRLARTF